MISFTSLPPVTKNLIIVNVIVFLAQNLVPGFDESLSLKFYQSPGFEPVQLLTHMFMHSTYDISHLLYNMLPILFFGPLLEQRLGSMRLLSLYVLTGFGGSILYTAATYAEHYETIQYLASLESNRLVDYQSIMQLSNARDIAEIGARLNYYKIADGSSISDVHLAQLYNGVTHPVIGASGAVFGILAALASLFPNIRPFLFIPLPVKYLVPIYSAYELYAGVVVRDDGVAHFAHVGGALFGYLIIKEWRKKHLL